MKKLKIMTVVGTRPEIIRLSCVLAKLDQYCDHVLVHTGQNYDYELNEIFFQDLEIRKPDYFLNAAGGNGAETIGNVIIAVDRLRMKCSQRPCWCWVIPIVACPYFRPSVARYQPSTWKPETVASTCGCRRRLIVELLITRLILI